MNEKINLEYLKEISDGDDSFVEDMIQSFITQTPRMFSEMEEFINYDDYTAAAKQAHKIKPTFEYVGLTETRNKVEILEYALKNGEEKNVIVKMVNDLKPLVESATKELKKLTRK